LTPSTKPCRADHDQGSSAGSRSSARCCCIRTQIDYESAVIIADASGTIRWIAAHRDYATRTEPGLVLQAITQTIA
jgi:hypothetical protein